MSDIVIGWWAMDDVQRLAFWAAVGLGYWVFTRLLRRAIR